MHLYMTLILELGIYTVFYKPIHWSSGWTSELQMIVKDGNVMCKKKKMTKIKQKNFNCYNCYSFSLEFEF